jgi:hypothetical protein
VCRLLEDPALIQAEIQRRLQTLRVAHPASQRREGLQRELVRARQPCKPSSTRSTPNCTTPRATSSSPRRSRASARLGSSAEQLTIEQRQQTVRLLVREVLISDEQVTIRHSIPTPQGHQPLSSSLRLGDQRGARQERGVGLALRLLSDVVLEQSSLVGFDLSGQQTNPWKSPMADTAVAVSKTGMGVSVHRGVRIPPPSPFLSSRWLKRCLTEVGRDPLPA